MEQIKKCLQCGGEIVTKGKTGVPRCKYCGTEYKHSVEGYSEEEMKSLCEALRKSVPITVMNLQKIPSVCLRL